MNSGFNDSKQLSAEKRAALFKDIQSSESIGFVLRVLHASEISRNMLRKAPYNLNAMSHDAAIEMIWAVLDAGVKIDTWYVLLQLKKMTLLHILISELQSIATHLASLTLLASLTCTERNLNVCLKEKVLPSLLRRRQMQNMRAALLHLWVSCHFRHCFCIVLSCI